MLQSKILLTTFALSGEQKIFRAGTMKSIRAISCLGLSRQVELSMSMMSIHGMLEAMANLIRNRHPRAHPERGKGTALTLRAGAVPDFLTMEGIMGMFD